MQFVSRLYHTHVKDLWHSQMNESWLTGFQEYDAQNRNLVRAHLNESWHSQTNESWLLHLEKYVRTRCKSGACAYEWVMARTYVWVMALMNEWVVTLAFGEICTHTRKIWCVRICMSHSTHVYMSRDSHSFQKGARARPTTSAYACKLFKALTCEWVVTPRF